MHVNIGSPYQIEFFNSTVEGEVANWPAGIAAHFSLIAQRIVEHGPDLGMPHTRALGQGLFEVRARGREGISRALFCVLHERRVVILHAFIKKTRALTDQDLSIARRRLKQVRDDKR